MSGTSSADSPCVAPVTGASAGIGEATARPGLGVAQRVCLLRRFVPASGFDKSLRKQLGPQAVHSNPRNTMKLTDNTILITGGASGIGRGLAEAFHQRGNKVIIAGRRKALLDEVAAAHPGMDAIELDVGDLSSVDAAARTLIARYPSLNVLINNAGIMPFDNAADPIDDGVARNIIDTNLLGPIRLTSALIEHLKCQPRATIIHNTSILAYLPLAGSAVYSASKAALHSYAMSQRFMLSGTTVSVQEIAPPWVDTDLLGVRGDPRAMPLDAFIAETMTLLESEQEELVVEAVRMIRANPGPNEHALFTAFNADLIANPPAHA